MDTTRCQTRVVSRGKASQCLKSPQSPRFSPHLHNCGQLRGKEIQTDLFPGFKQSNRDPFFSSTLKKCSLLFQQPLPLPARFLAVGSPAMLEIQQEGMLTGQRGLTCLPSCSLLQQRVCLQLQSMSWSSLEQETHFSCWTRWNSHCYLIYISMLVTYRWLLFIDL